MRGSIETRERQVEELEETRGREVAETEERVQALRAELQALKRPPQGKPQSETVQVDVQSVLAENEALRHQVADVEQRITGVRSTIDRLESQCQRLSRRLLGQTPENPQAGFAEIMAWRLEST